MDVSASFQFVADALGDDWRVLAPDWRGYGQTDSSGADAYWFPDYLADLECLLDLLTPGVPVRLVGHSMGGWVGAAAAVTDRTTTRTSERTRATPLREPRSARRRARKEECFIVGSVDSVHEEDRGLQARRFGRLPSEAGAFARADQLHSAQPRRAAARSPGPRLAPAPDRRSGRAGGPQRGQVFAYTPRDGRLRLVFHSPAPEVLDSPDNICVSPRGGLVLCEDGSGREYLHVLTPDGDIFPFAENNIVLAGERGFFGDFTGSEWCGATFEPKNGNWLFVNIQAPGITFAITGPFRRYGL